MCGFSSARELGTDLSRYDGKCVKCHMPKIQIAGLHDAFTGHQVRVPRADGRYPE
jgi:hypothetical protein